MIKQTYLPKNVLYPNPQQNDDLWCGYQPRTVPILSIIIHSTNNNDGNTSFASEVKFLHETKSVAADYLVGAEEIVQFLDSSKWYAWHAGAVSNRLYANQHSIGIETHYSPKDTKPFDTRIKDNLTVLVRKLMTRYSMPSDLIMMHRTVAVPNGRKVDPSWMTDSQFLQWRETLRVPALKHYFVVNDTPIYEAPSRTTIALGGTAKVVKGSEFDGINQGNGYIWHNSGIGFIPATAVSDTKPL